MTEQRVGFVWRYACNNVFNDVITDAHLAQDEP